MSFMKNKTFNVILIVFIVLSLYIFGLANISEENITIPLVAEKVVDNEFIGPPCPTELLVAITDEMIVDNTTKEDVIEEITTEVKEDVVETKEEYIVTANVLNIRENPDINSKIIGTYKMGEIITVIDKVDVWYKTDKGYCHSNYLRGKNNNIEVNEEKYIVTANVLNIRENPDINSKIIGTYKMGERIAVIDKVDVWYKTDIGYCHSKYLIKDINTIKNQTFASRHIETINKLINIPQTIYDNILIKSNLTAEHIEILISDTNLSGIGEAIVAIEEIYGVNCFVTLAVARLESANGTSKIARHKNNLFGLGAYDSNPYYHAFSFSSKDQSVYKFGEVINDIYISNNRTCLKSINEIYASSQAWAKKVMDIIKSDYNRINKIINES